MDGSWLEWTLGIILFTIYVTAIFTVCLVTFQKGRWLLGVLGIIFPVLWFIGAMLPAKEGSRYEIEQQMDYQRQVQQYTS